MGHAFTKFLKRSSAAIAVFAMTASISNAQQPTFGPQSSTKNVEWGFDFVETFDGLDDWPSSLSSSAVDHGNVGHPGVDEGYMPTITGGGMGAWEYYSNWGGGPHSPSVPTQYWIDAYGDNRVWRGSKSAAIDIGSTHKGPSRLGLYFFPGYTNFHVFFMVKIPKNEWPTDTDAGVYTEGQPYDWFSAWKFTTINFDCLVKACWTDGGGYSPNGKQLLNVRQYNYGASPGITFLVTNDHGSSHGNKYAADGGVNLDSYDSGGTPLGLIGDWMGVEHQVTQINNVTTHNIWVYDKNGNSWQVANNMSWSGVFPSNPKIDFFFIGGNNSGTYDWGPTMQSVYYIDDVIIDDERIGPKYFSLIGGGTPPASPPLPPSGLTISGQ